MRPPLQCKSTCHRGGIGRRAWFRSMYRQRCGGSSPFDGTSSFQLSLTSSSRKSPILAKAARNGALTFGTVSAFHCSSMLPAENGAQCWAGQERRIEDFTEGALRAAGDDDAGPAARAGSDQDPRDRGGERSAGEVSGVDPAGAEECAHCGQCARRARRIPVAARSGGDSSERYYPAGRWAACTVGRCRAIAWHDCEGCGPPRSLRSVSGSAGRGRKDSGEYDHRRHRGPPGRQEGIGRQKRADRSEEKVGRCLAVSIKSVAGRGVRAIFTNSEGATGLPVCLPWSREDLETSTRRGFCENRFPPCTKTGHSLVNELHSIENTCT